MEKRISELYVRIEPLLTRYPILEQAKDDIIKGYLVLQQLYQNGGKLLIAGNGGSAADAETLSKTATGIERICGEIDTN